MRRFPKFLLQNPKFMGFELADLFILLALFQLLTLFGVETIVSLVSSLATVVSLHLFSRKFDLIGFIASKRLKSISWVEELKKRGL